MEQGRPLELADRRVIEAVLGASGDAPSEFCFANLYLFRWRHRYRLCDTPVPHIRGVTYDGLTHALPLAGLDAVASELPAFDVDCLFPLGEEALALGEAWGLEVSHVPADSDYIFDGPGMAGLHLAKARAAQALAFAAAARPDWEDWRPSLEDDAKAVLAGWLSDIGRAIGETDFAECVEAIDCAVALGLEGGLVRAGEGQPVGFLLASRREDGERVVHFAKGRRAHSGAYPWMFSRYARRSGARRLNFEQDLGKPGLAQSKRAYSPVALRVKHRLLLGRAHGGASASGRSALSPQRKLLRT